jgi:hypothetical protein
MPRPATPKEPQPLKGFFADLFRAIYIFSPSIIFQIIYYYIIVGFSIGQDILMQSAESIPRAVATAFSVAMWMIFSWFSSRNVEKAYTQRVPVSHPGVYSHLPRLLGYNVAVGIQIAALNLPTIGAFNFWQLLIVFAFHNLFYFVLNRVFTDRTKLSIGIALALGIGYLFFIVLQYLGSGAMKHQDHRLTWFFLSIIFFTIQIAFVYLVIRRRKFINTHTGKPINFEKIYNIVSVCIAVLFLAIVIFPKFAIHYGSFGVVLLGFGLWVGAIYFLRYWAMIWKVRFGLIILLMAILFGIWFKSPYQVQFLPSTESRPNRMPIDQYIEKWFARRKPMIEQAGPDKKYRIYLVTADGGASKSGYWVSSILAKEQDGSMGTGDLFSDHILSLAGASGGSVGNAAFYTTIQDGSIKNHRDEVARFFSGDFLTYSLARFLSFDILRHLVPIFPVPDRTAALEESMEKLSSSETIGRAFSKSFHSLVDTTARMPMLFINTTNLETGTPGILSTVNIRTLDSNRIDVMSLAEKKPDTIMKLSTAVVLGARFPYISPAGEIDGKYFVDGGYFDNSGAGITLEILQYLEKALNDSTHKLYGYRNHIEFQLIYISNGNASSTFKTLHPLVNDLAAPLLTILNTYGMQTTFANIKLEEYQRKNRYRSIKPVAPFNLPYLKEDTIPYPMNWVISKYNINRMNENVNKVQLDRIK